MQYRTLGRTGVQVAPLALGTDNFLDPTPADESARMLAMSMDHGVNLIDTGDTYANGAGEKIIGETLRKLGRRDEVLLATKVDHGQRRPGFSVDDPAQFGPNDHGHSRLNIIRACENSLKRLQTDYIDLYQLHRPSPNIPWEERLSALDALVAQGKVRYIGCSTHPAWAVMNAIMVSELKGYARIVSEQPPYNLLDRRIENELLPMCTAHGIGVITWSPMAMGVLAGRYADADHPPKDSRAVLRGGFYAERVTGRGIEVGAAFNKIARSIGLSAAQLAVLWCKDQPGITAPLIGPRTIGQLGELLDVMERRLDPETRRACDALVPPGAAVVNFHNTSGWMKASGSPG